jgi:hypothetical protein
MKKQIKRELYTIIDKYSKGLYSEKDFHSSLSSLIIRITELELLNVREFLETSESKLEQIDFLVDKKEEGKEYQKVIIEIEKYLESI